VDRRCLMARVAMLPLAIALHTAASAQDVDPAATPAAPPSVQPAASSALSEIVVTATRRSTNLQTTPVAVSAVDSSLIRQAAPRDISDLSTFVPNFSSAKITGYNAASFALRGVSVNNIIVYYEAPVGVLVDDFVMPSVQTQLLDTFDIEQIEVLRGPQGTLFGKNTTGGAVTVRTKKPDLEKFGAEAKLSYGTFNELDAHAAVNVPIVKDKLALRLVGGYERSDGYARDGYCYGPVNSFAAPGTYGAKFNGVSGCGDGHRIGGQKVYSGRAKLLFQPSDAASIELQYEIMRDQSPEPASLNATDPAVPGFLFNTLGVGGAKNLVGDPLDHMGTTGRNGEYISNSPHVNVDGIYLNANFDMGIGTLTNVTGWRYQRSRLSSSSTGTGPIVAPDGDGLSLYDLNRSDNRRTFQQELRFASKLSGPFNFVSGIFYQHEDVNFCVAQVIGFQDLAGLSTPYGPWNENPYVLCNRQRSDSTAVYTEGTLNLAKGLTLTVGGRYTWEDKLWQGRQQSFVQDITQDPTKTWRDQSLISLSDFNRYPVGVVQDHANFRKPTWRGSLSYRFTPTIYGYATYSRGFKGGDFNDQIGTFAPFGTNLAAFQAAATATKPETADSYEAGVKTEFFNHRLRANVTGFYVKYKNLQKQIVVPQTINGQSFQVTRFFNAASADVKGIEAELTAIPVHGLTIRGTLGYQDGKYNRYDTPIPAGYDLASAPLDRLPKWQWSMDGTYEHPVFGDFSGFVNASVSFTDRNLFSQSIQSPDQNAYLEKRTLVNASIGVNGPHNAYTIRFIGRNLTDKRYKNSELIVGGLWSFANYGMPRTFAVEGTVKF
jgi:iron complex outermembrane recepter protein